MPSIRHISIRHAVPAALVAGMLLSSIPAATALGAEPPDEVLAAEWKVLTHMNVVRENNGLRPLRMAGRVRVAARDRSRSFKNQNYFGHVAPSGGTAGTLLGRRDIKHDYWGEAIGWTVNMGLNGGAKWMVDWWKKSTPHRRLMLRKDFNYAGIGIAREGTKTYWTIVFVNQPDHTPPKAGLVGSGTGTFATAAGSTTLRWWGIDRKLSTRTAGMKHFTLQRKTRAGLWRTILQRTKSKQITLNLGTGEHMFRVRATDKRGNHGGLRNTLRVVVS